jgi:hypothetical protein
MEPHSLQGKTLEKTGSKWELPILPLPTIKKKENKCKSEKKEEPMKHLGFRKMLGWAKKEGPIPTRELGASN